MTPTSIVAYITLFAAVGFLFLFAALLLGRFLRASAPSPEKLQAYECGEPPVGPGDVQFDLRFYVVALVFIIFEVEVAFFFPWATVFGGATRLMASAVATPSETGASTQGAANLIDVPGEALEPGVAAELGRRLAGAAMVDMGVFFAVLMVGFFYVWYRGDLDWVRAVDARRRVE
jgi:NADH-quinone oxidoreductase subunit A